MASSAARTASTRRGACVAGVSHTAAAAIACAATKLKSSTSAASSPGSDPCVFTRRRNSSLSRSITLVVRIVFHCPFGKRKKVSSSSPPSARLRTTPGQRGFHFFSKALQAVRAADSLSA